MAPARYIRVALLMGLLATLVSAFLLAQPWSTQIDVGDGLDRPYLQNFYPREYSEAQQLTFRWSQPAASVVLPGAGPVVPLELRVHGDYEQMPLRIDAGTGGADITLRTGWQRVLLLPRAAGWSGNVVVRLETPPQVAPNDPRERGVAIDRIALRGQGGALLLGQAVLLGISTALAALLVGWSSRRAWLGALTGSVLVCAMMLVLARTDGAWRLFLMSDTVPLALGFALACGLALAVSAFLSRLAARSIIPASSATRRALAATTVLAFLVRFIGMSYPLNYISDIRFILARARMVRDGRLLELFLPNPTLTPVQWEMNVTVPRSPFFYVLTAPLTYLPEPWPGVAMMALSSVVDALTVLLVGVLMLYMGAGRRGAVLATLLAAILPLGLVLAVSWGVYTTLFAQWLMVLTIAAWLYLRPQLNTRRAQVALTLLFALAYLSYPTAVLFLGITWAILLVVLWLQRDTAFKATLGTGLGGAALALIVYYGWHIPEIVSRTLPTMGQKVAGEGDSSWTITSLMRPIWNPIQQWYGPLLLSLAGLGALLWANKPLSRRRTAVGAVVCAWVVTYPLLALVDARVATLILKHVLYVLPLIALLAGLTLGRLAERRWGWVVAAAVVGLIMWQGLSIEANLIVSANQGLK